MAKPRAFSHLLFDLDHTLTYYPLSTAGVVAQSLQRLGLSAASFGSAESAATRYDALWVALQKDARTADELRRAIWERIVAESGLTSEGLAKQIATEYTAVRDAHGPRLVEGARELLSELRDAGYGLGLLTNGEGYLQWQTIRAFALEPLFDVLVVCGDIGAYKPEPRAFSTLLDRLGAAPAQALFVGDSYEMDIVGAHGVGLATAWIRPNGTPRPGSVVPTYEFASVLGVREAAL
jgi:HAD superfamily hydrolase (TIGR01549 family)